MAPKTGGAKNTRDWQIGELDYLNSGRFGGPYLADRMDPANPNLAPTYPNLHLLRDLALAPNRQLGRFSIQFSA